MTTRRDGWEALAARHRADAHRLRRSHGIGSEEPICIDPTLGMTEAQREAEAAYFAECFRWRPGRAP